MQGMTTLAPSGVAATLVQPSLAQEQSETKTKKATHDKIVNGRLLFRQHFLDSTWIELPPPNEVIFNMLQIYFMYKRAKYASDWRTHFAIANIRRKIEIAKFIILNTLPNLK